jgi:hypothetical protein
MSWRVHVELALWRHGGTLPLAAMLALLAVAIHETAVLPAQASLALAQEELASATRSAPRTLALHQPLHALRDALPAEASATGSVKRMAALAQSHGIAVQQADYQRTALTGAPVIQLQVSQPVRASYAQLRRYIEAVLRDMPHVSLDHVAARRDNVGQQQLEVRLRWSVWMQQEAGATR